VTESAEELSLLVGYDKKQAYYTYWLEYGRKGRPQSRIFAARAMARLRPH